MFLIERMISIGIYMFVLLYVCSFLIKTNASCKLILRVYLACLCIMAFFYKPYTTGDLYRIFKQMDYFATMDFGLFWNNFALESSIPVSRLLFWLFGKTGVNELLPVFSALVCYSLLFYIINKTKELYDISNQTIAIVLFYIMTTSIYISVIGGIRMMLALCIIAFSYFRGVIEKKITLVDVLLYIVSIFIHAMGIVVIGICVCTSLFISSKKLLKKIGFAAGVVLVGVAFAVNFNDLLYALYQKFLEYVLGDKHSDPWEYVMGVIIILIMLLMFVEFRNLCRDKDYLQVKKYTMASVLSVIIAVCFCFEFSIFYRFGAHVAVLFSIPSMMISLENTKGRSGRVFTKIDFKSVIVLLSLITAAVSCTRGSLCSLKFFEL